MQQRMQQQQSKMFKPQAGLLSAPSRRTILQHKWPCNAAAAARAGAAAAAAHDARICTRHFAGACSSSSSTCSSSISSSSPCLPRRACDQRKHVVTTAAAAAADMHHHHQNQQQQHHYHQSRRRLVRAHSAASAAAGSGAGGDDAFSQQQQDASTPATPPSTQLPARRPLLQRLRPWSLGAPLAWGLMLGYILVMLMLPIAALLGKASAVPLETFWARATEPVALSAYYVSFSMALVAALVNCVFGFVLAWVLVKFDFPGKKWIDAAVDLPFALPTSVAGLTLATVYSEEGVLGALLTRLGVNVVFTRLGVAVAMVFVSFPFVVRTMQPVLQEMEREVEEAAWSLGASPWETFSRVLLPPLLPPLLTGAALAFSRAVGEFGSIVIVSSNFPFKDLIAPVLIFQSLEQYDYVGATVIGTVLLLISMALMVGVNFLQSVAARARSGK